MALTDINRLSSSYKNSVSNRSRLITYIIIGIASLFAMPIITIVFSLTLPFNEQWDHLVNFLLNTYIVNTFILMLGVSFGVLTIGVSCAWLTTMCQFPGRRFFSWALLLPLAMPAYIVAYTYTGLMDFSGPIQSALREIFDWKYGDYTFPEIRSINGAIIVLSLVLYPYVYIMARAAFLEQSICVLEVSRTLGCTPFKSFLKVAIPLARPALVVGLSLTLMEVLADYGTVQYFGVDTFTTGIFRVWFGMEDSQSAAQLASVLLIFVVTLILLESISRQKSKFHHTSNRYSSIERLPLSKTAATLAFILCMLPILSGFFIPSAQLLYWSLFISNQPIDYTFLKLVLDSLSLAVITAIIAMVIALISCYGKRALKRPSVSIAVKMISFGYAIPGTVIAVGVLIPLGWIDNKLDDWFRANLGMSTGLIFSGTLFALVFAYLVRFLSVSIQGVDAGLNKIKETLDDAARTLGETPFGVIINVHLPVMKSSIIATTILVFVDVLKELPATLILRPFNFNTLAVKAYELASDERLIDVGPPALTIVLIAIIPVILLNRIMDNNRQLKQTENA